ncbi:hypothetical protein F5878DRAFT_600259 [Lentinula raphanica]|uniref:Rpr2-domain-containing protein n=1 Tax=Lentinula raphanica TaxID=153919 RepID=A0AA38PLH7_9AGAR|nr:hypothetical protein C8R42DRAFT_641207 [Lentinula raphanica]KAJ3821986.1 hypothetical protein F5880DRAFT_1614208 [Lentinula raphanica]KAJ3845138.1 hypothetical protein F5878DRAFT_600259 [Lentinula raphanica]
MDVTAKFQNSIPYTLQSVSPALAALHTRRIRKISTEPTNTDSQAHHCAQCGFYLFDGDSSTRIVRIKRRRTDAPTRIHNGSSSSRARQSTCLQCGWVNVTYFDLDSEPASLFPIRKPSLSSKADDSKRPHHDLATVNAIPETDAPHIGFHALSAQQQPTSPQLVNSSRSSAKSDSISVPVKSKSRPKKKSGLHEMLAQNRAKEEKAKNASSNGQTNLAAFLESL